MAQSDGKFIFVKRLADGKVIDMNNWEWQDWKRKEERGGQKLFEFIEEVDTNASGETPEERAKPPVTKMTDKLQIIDDPFECPICGEISKNEKSLKIHKKKKHKF